MKNWKQIIGIVVLSVLITQGVNTLLPKPAQDYNAIAPASGSALDRIIEKGVLRCAYIPYPPFFEINPNTGEKFGLSYDLMEEIGKKLNLKIEWTEEVAWGNLTEGLKTNRYDAVCSAIWQNSARSLHADFSKPYGYSVVEVWARADDARFDHNLNAINSEMIKISVIDGEATTSLADENFPKAQKISLPQYSPFSDLFLNVKNGKADIVLAEPKIATEFLKSNPNSLKKVNTDKPISAYPIVIGLPKGETELKTTIDNTLDEIFFTREIEKIMEKYNLTKDDFYLPARPF